MVAMGKLTDKQLVAHAQAFREGILSGAESKMMCAAISWPLAALLRARGVDCECVESDLGHINHVWIKLADGRVLDPTADQFNTMGFNDVPQLPPVYLGKPLVIHPTESVGHGQAKH